MGLDDVHSFLKAITEGYPVIHHLFPDNEMSIKELMEKSSKSYSEVFRQIKKCVQAEAVSTRKEKQGRGAPKDFHSLTEVTRKVFNIIEGVESSEEISLRRIEIIHHMIKTGNPDVVKSFAEELFLLSRNHKIPGFLDIFENIYRNLSDKKYDTIRVDLLLTLRNIATRFNPTEREQAKSFLGEELKQIIINPTDDDRINRSRIIRGRIEAIKTLSAIYESDLGYKTLLSYYKLSHDWGIADIRYELRRQILDNYPERTEEFRNILLYMLKEGKNEETIREDLTQIPL